MNLQPRYVASATLSIPDGGALILGALPSGVVAELLPFWKGDKGDKGDTPGATRALLWPIHAQAEPTAVQQASFGVFSLPPDCEPASVIAVLNGQELWTDDYTIDPAAHTLDLGETLLQTDRFWIRYTLTPPAP